MQNYTNYKIKLTYLIRKAEKTYSDSFETLMGIYGTLETHR